MNMLKWCLVGLAGVLLAPAAGAQTQPAPSQMRPAGGPATALIVTLNNRIYWAELDAGLVVEIKPNGRAVIRVVDAPNPNTHRHINDAVPVLTVENNRTCATFPTNAQNIRLFLNGLRVSSGVDYTEPAPGTNKFCFLELFGNLTADGENKGVVRADYTITP